jgi:hypothetical protein
MKNKLKLYSKNLNIIRHTADSRWYSPAKLPFWKPSVTTIIGGALSKGKGFDQWLGNHPSYKIACEERDTAAARGNEVHELAEQYMLGHKVSGSTDEINKHLMSFEKFWQDNEIELIATELFMWHADVPWAGTCDIIAKVNDNYSIIDIKTGNYYKSHEIQLTMYAELYNHIAKEYKIPEVTKIYGLYTKGKWIREPNYQFKSFKINLDVAIAVKDVWTFLQGGKPYPKPKPNIKTEFKLEKESSYDRL